MHSNRTSGFCLLVFGRESVQVFPRPNLLQGDRGPSSTSESRLETIEFQSHHLKNFEPDLCLCFTISGHRSDLVKNDLRRWHPSESISGHLPIDDIPPSHPDSHFDHQLTLKSRHDPNHTRPYPKSKYGQFSDPGHLIHLKTNKGRSRPSKVLRTRIIGGK